MSSSIMQGSGAGPLERNAFQESYSDSVQSISAWVALSPIVFIDSSL